MTRRRDASLPPPRPSWNLRAARYSIARRTCVPESYRESIVRKTRATSRRTRMELLPRRDRKCATRCTWSGSDMTHPPRRGARSGETAGLSNEVRDRARAIFLLAAFRDSLRMRAPLDANFAILPRSNPDATLLRTFDSAP